jgi:peroxin-11B
MSATISQVILHPTVSHALTVLGTTLGREKAYRAIQYFSRFLAWFLLRRGKVNEAARWEALKNAMASCRKSELHLLLSTFLAF